MDLMYIQALTGFLNKVLIENNKKGKMLKLLGRFNLNKKDKELVFKSFEKSNNILENTKIYACLKEKFIKKYNKKF